MDTKVSIISLGCPKNTIDSERMLGRLAGGGAVICARPEDADVVLVATCSFIDEARRETLRAVDEMLALKAAGKIKAVIVTGCMVEHFGRDLEDALPGVDAFAGFGAFGNIRRIVDRAGAGGKPFFTQPALPEKLGYEGARLRITPEHYAFLRISEGCDNRCAYCAIPAIRGNMRSKPARAVLREARELAGHGVRELILVAEDTTAWGRDLPGRPKLAGLLEKLEEIDGIEWIRVLYAYPSHVDKALVKVFGRGKKLVPYLDVPIQHASTRILKRMGRSYTAEKLRAVIEELKAARPDMVLRTSIITGFPGETEKDQKELLRFIEAGWFERLGCFTYSPEAGTRAFKMDGVVPEKTALERQMEIMEAAAGVLGSFHRSLVGGKVQVIVDSGKSGSSGLVGRTCADAPDIDAVVRLTAGTGVSTGEIVEAEIIGTEGYDLIGKVM